MHPFETGTVRWVGRIGFSRECSRLIVAGFEIYFTRRGEECAGALSLCFWGGDGGEARYRNGIGPPVRGDIEERSLDDGYVGFSGRWSVYFFLCLSARKFSLSVGWLWSNFQNGLGCMLVLSKIPLNCYSIRNMGHGSGGNVL